MSENTPKNPQESEPQDTDSPEPQDTDSPESQTPDEEKSIGAEAIVNAPPTAEISEASASGPDDGSSDDVVRAPLATEAGEFRTSPMDLNVPFSAGTGQEHGSAQAQHPSATEYPTQQYTRPYPQTSVMNANSSQVSP
ncbi:MAG: hypothetical protein L0G69_18095, partial [Brevibacterium sp.]|nr:hypothetical protein [Brevibacterium sp.]